MDAKIKVWLTNKLFWLCIALSLTVGFGYMAYKYSFSEPSPFEYKVYTLLFCIFILATVTFTIYNIYRGLKNQWNEYKTDHYNNDDDFN